MCTFRVTNMEKSCLLCHIWAAFYSALRYFYNCVLLTHRALLLTSSGQIEVTKLAIGSNYTNHSNWKYKGIQKIYQTNCLSNYLNLNLNEKILHPFAHFITLICPLRGIVNCGQDIAQTDPYPLHLGRPNQWKVLVYSWWVIW